MRIARDSCEICADRVEFVKAGGRVDSELAACATCVPCLRGGVGPRWRGCGLMEDFDNDDDDTTTTRPGPQLTAERPDDPDPNRRHVHPA